MPLTFTSKFSKDPFYFRPSTDIDWKENNVVKHGVENGGSLGQHSHAGPLLVNGQQQLQQVVYTACEEFGKFLDMKTPH